ncbi:MAG: hypothetical protein A2070_06520 [Bdellovibrionales bacterium GWC1_52_8]|nr:MAG: hypothetical protein A2Z97_04780 [Bdellovibrionales bacterium GWB1_52_6]OFZ05567.1 MAG: hypothetical protein A2X97_11915 [Bdellovibrionales bacterium GWA1_52_35]OFZ41466.1 MAG: hypothetical protein A2070_06520 [Bdellovibrionales bacterium GWC1_52_8]
MEEILKTFGRYFLLDLLAHGGMADIYRACPATSAGISRLLVIKRMRKEFVSNSEFLNMFQSEIKVTMGFNHQNIAQVYDYGEVNHIPYIAMEYVEGFSLSSMLKALLSDQLRFPIDLAIHIVAQVAAGLDYAHSYKSKSTGELLKIIHRDISPQNILISCDGNVKVIDFGIAKATSNMDATRTGMIKGKPSYLAPEQVADTAVDARCDQFALGLVLWEVLAGRKLFTGTTEMAILQKLLNAKDEIHSTTVHRKDVPPEVDQIVLKMLAIDPSDRYASCLDVYQALHQLLYRLSPSFDPRSLATFSCNLFKAEIKHDREKVKDLIKKSAYLLQKSNDDEPKTIYENFSNIEKAAPVPVSVPELAPIPAPAPAAAPNEARSSGSIDLLNAEREILQKDRRKRSKATFIVIGLIGVLVLISSATDRGIKIPGLSFLSDTIGRAVAGRATVVLSGSEKDVYVLVGNIQTGGALPMHISRVPTGKPVKIVVTHPTLGNFEQIIILRPGETRNLPVLLTQKTNTLKNIISDGMAGP